MAFACGPMMAPLLWYLNPLSSHLFVCLFALRPKSTAMVIAGRSVHLTTLVSWASLNKQLTSNRAHTFACNWQQPFMNDSAEGRRMTVEIISWSISTKVWDRAGIELATPWSAVSFASVTRHVTDCATRPGTPLLSFQLKSVSKLDRLRQNFVDPCTIWTHRGFLQWLSYKTLTPGEFGPFLFHSLVNLICLFGVLY